MKNTLGDLNNHLFAQLERLSDEDLKGDSLQDEILRTKAVTDVAIQIIDNARLVLKAQELSFEHGNGTEKMPKMLEG